MAKSEAWFQLFFVFLVILNLHFLIFQLSDHFITFVIDHLFSVLEILCSSLMQYFFPIVFLLKNTVIYSCNHMTIFPVKQKNIRESNFIEERINSSWVCKKFPRQHCRLHRPCVGEMREHLEVEATQLKRGNKPIKGNFPLNGHFSSSYI